NTLNNSINPNILLEQNQKSVNTLILKKMLNNQYIYNTNDSTALMDIAAQCPLQGGNAVYQARNLLAAIYNELIDFEDNCEETQKHFVANNETESITQHFSKAVKLYPNPNNGNMMLDYSLNETEVGKLNIYDVSGRLIDSYNLLSGENKQLNINKTDLENGIYFYEVIINDKLQASDKLIIIK
ncbi:MAG: T9SS type A sorting domain-containing protein, partial [Bacteroidetes bacterium]|nr:T9SS type A sorting domain-containing protein [Bacteroidota bacterium]